MWLWRIMFIRWGKETWKRGNGGGEYEGVDEGKMEGLHSLLHTVGFFFYFPFQVPSALFTKPTDSTRERERERQRERESGRLRQRGRGKASARTCVRATSEHLVSVPASTLTAPKGLGMRESLLGPYSLLMVARTHTHALLL
jgi:hypothetical protein